jgi:nuclear inhibitor of protein phosphatase 1
LPISAHGTFIGNIRIEGNKPTPLPVDSQFHFGASSRIYIIRERPQAGPRPIMDELEKSSGDVAATLLGKTRLNLCFVAL